MIVYRYDDEDYGENTLIRSRGDSFSMLTEPQKQVELAIRATLLDGVNIRSSSVYTWADGKLAKRLWCLSKKKYLYELETEKANIRHIADLNWYSAAVDAIIAHVSPENAIDKYCSGRAYWSTLHATSH